MEISRWCADCGDEQVFVQPECVDGHGADCPEWACSACGAAYLVGSAPRPVAARQASAA